MEYRLCNKFLKKSIMSKGCMKNKYYYNLSPFFFDFEYWLILKLKEK